MSRNWKHWLVAAGLLVPSLALAQQPCTAGIRVDGTVTDPTGAVIPGAQVQSSGGEKTITDDVGRFLLLCVPVGSKQITTEAEGFTSGTVTVNKEAGGSIHLNLHLEIAHVSIMGSGRRLRLGIDAIDLDRKYSSGIGYNPLHIDLRDAIFLFEGPGYVDLSVDSGCKADGKYEDGNDSCNRPTGMRTADQHFKVS